MGLRGIEDRLERLVEGSLTMPFRGPMQPIEISHRMLREMDLGRRVGVRGLLAPNHFAVSISNDNTLSRARIVCFCLIRRGTSSRSSKPSS